MDVGPNIEDLLMTANRDVTVKMDDRRVGKATVLRSIY